jgi:hypothetical protein
MLKACTVKSVLRFLPQLMDLAGAAAEASGAAGGGTSASAEDNGEAFAGQPSVTELLAIRRTAHRNAMELAVTAGLSHPNIIQVGNEVACGVRIEPSCISASLACST